MADSGGEKRKAKAGQKKGKPDKKGPKAEAQGRKKPDGRRRASLIIAISNPLRRRIMRVIHDRGEAASPTKIAKKLRLPIDTVGYHVRVLRQLGAVELAGEQQVRGAVEHFYDSTIEDDPPIETLLEETREADDEDK